ncbi:hypothetical protein E1267_35145 [Nonomuraea longispora]|uniref:Uncharacterized protein n=1 Tax=Nonomuraea longispora TaxID=1848320 RepID=A0A4R4N0T3_9ACTN|nr:hypothetical protein E1267_35145 [Nonomuraea longispora]
MAGRPVCRRYDLLVKGGTVVLPHHGEIRADLAVSEGKSTCTSDGPPPAAGPRPAHSPRPRPRPRPRRRSPARRGRGRDAGRTPCPRRLRR